MNSKKDIFNRGYFKIPYLINLNTLKKINFKIHKILLTPSYLMKAIDFSKMKNKNLRGVLIHKKNFFLSKKNIAKGVKFFSQKTNSIQIKDVLIRLPELNEYIFSKKLYLFFKNYFKDTNFFLLYGVLRIHFNNKLPELDANFFHLDKTYNKSEKSKQILKFSIPLTLIKNKKIDSSEFNLVTLKKNNFKKKEIDFLDYKLKKELPIKVRNKISNPKIKSGDCLIFDPVNFFHMANKPKNLRVVFYGVIGRKTNYIAKKTQRIKIFKKDYDKLKNYQKKFGSLLTSI